MISVTSRCVDIWSCGVFDQMYLPMAYKPMVLNTYDYNAEAFESSVHALF
jgi:hypothetical protein